MKRPHVRIATPALALFLALGAVPSGIEAQLPFRLGLGPFAGALDPRGDVPGAPFLDMGLLGYSAFDPAWAAGAALEVGPRTLPVALRLSGSRSVGSNQVGHFACPRGGVCTAVLVEVATQMTITTLGLDLTGRIGLGPLGLHPSVGAGWVRYDYRWDPTGYQERSLEPGAARADGLGARAGFGISGALTERARLRADWFELLAGGDHDRTRPTRLSSFTLGIEFPLGL